MPHLGHEHCAPISNCVPQRGHTLSVAASTIANCLLKVGSFGVRSRYHKSNTAPSGEATRSSQDRRASLGSTGAIQKIRAKASKAISPAHLKERRVLTLARGLREHTVHTQRFQN